MACVLRSSKALTSRHLDGLSSTAFVSIRHASRACFQDVERKRKTGAKQLNNRKMMIASQLQDTFNKHDMVAVYHYNGLNTQEWNGIRHKLSENGIHIKIFPSKVSMKSLQETRYVHISPLFRGCTAVAYAKEASSAKELLSVTKLESKLHLLGGVVEDIMMTPVGLQDYADLPPLKDLQQMLLGTLNQTQMMLVRSLEGTSQKLSQLLSQISDSPSNNPT